MVAIALDISASPEGGWRVERITGPEEALDELETVYMDTDICNECAYPHPSCDDEVEYQVLERETTARTSYRFTTDVSYYHSVSYLAREYLAKGALLLIVRLERLALVVFADRVEWGILRELSLRYRH